MAHPPLASSYEQQLARIHHDHFSDLARGAAAHLLGLLNEGHGHRAGTIVELACGGGVSSKILADAGYDVVGVDASKPMLELARAHAPDVAFEQASLWDYQLPPAVAVTAVGEAFCYHGSGSSPTHEALQARLRSVFAALSSGGVLLFDVATPGRSGPTRQRHAAWAKGGNFIYLHEAEDVETSSLHRIIDSFVPAGELHRHSREQHRLTLFDASRVAEMLAHIGFCWRQASKLGDFELLPGWVAFEAVKP